jgi:hypothetical protein
MKRSQLALAITGLLASSASFATPIDLTSTTGNRGPNYWASEVSATQSSTIRLAAAFSATAAPTPTGPLDVRMPLNIAIGKGDIRYLRVELSDSNAKFAEHPSCTLTAAYVDSSNNTGHSCVRSLGGKDANFVTFSVQSDGTNNSGLASNSIIGIALAAGTTPTNGGIIVSNTSAPVKMIYSLHTNKDSAENASYINSALLFKREFDYIAFSKVLDVKYTTGSDITSNVADDFIKFLTETDKAEAENGLLGTFSYGTSNSLAAGTFPTYISSNGIAVNAKTDLTQIVGTGTTFTLSSETPGGFSFIQDLVNNAPAGSYTGTALQNVFLHTTATFAACRGGASAGGTLSKSGAINADKATFEINVGGSGALFAVCVKANGKSVIDTNTFSGEFNPGARTNTKPEKVSGTVGKIIQNGTVLDTPYVTTIDGYISRVILTNTSGVDVKYSATSVTEEGATATPGTQASGTIPAKSILQLNLKDVVAFSGKPRGSVRFTIRGSNQQIGGVYQVIKSATATTTSGDVQSIPLIRKGGG